MEPYKKLSYCENCSAVHFGIDNLSRPYICPTCSHVSKHNEIQLKDIPGVLPERKLPDHSHDASAGVEARIAGIKME